MNKAFEKGTDMTEKFKLPECLKKLDVSETAFRHWLQRKAESCQRRDKKRKIKGVTVSATKQRILKAIEEADGCDYYTGLQLDWKLISKWNNDEAFKRRGEYKIKFWNLPTIDHEVPSSDVTRLRLCSWQLNDAKNDQTIQELLILAENIRKHQLNVQPLRIVILDDDPLIAQTLKLMFERSVYQAEVLVFTHAEKALQELLRKSPDIFTTDQNHAKMSCDELFDVLAKREVKYPIFVISGLVDEINKEALLRRYLEQGLNVSLLAKPFSFEDLQKLLSKQFGSNFKRVEATLKLI